MGYSLEKTACTQNVKLKRLEEPQERAVTGCQWDWPGDLVTRRLLTTSERLVPMEGRSQGTNDK